MLALHFSRIVYISVYMNIFAEKDSAISRKLHGSILGVTQFNPLMLISYKLLSGSNTF